MKRSAGDWWRVQGNNGSMSHVHTDAEMGPFDEIVVGQREHDAWLHVKMMDDRSAFVQLGERCFWVYIPSKGAPRITMEETRPHTPFKRCRKRPGGRRCILVRGHTLDCYTDHPNDHVKTPG